MTYRVMANRTKRADISKCIRVVNFYFSLSRWGIYKGGSNRIALIKQIIDKGNEKEY
jgi:hypothetical protein